MTPLLRFRQREPQGWGGTVGGSMAGSVRSGGDVLLRRSPAQLWFVRRARLRLAVLGYHGISDPDTFAGQLDRLRRIARPVSLDEVEEALARRRSLPARAVLLTFDDGERSILEHGLPLLRERGIPGVAFVVASAIGSRTPFWWHEVERLVRAGARVPGEPARTGAGWLRHLKTVPQQTRLRLLADLREGHGPLVAAQLTAADLGTLESGGVRVENHSLTHPLLDRCTDADVRAEVVDAHERLTALLGRAPRSFAYPNGNWDVRAERLLAELGYRTGFLFDHRLGPRLPDHPLRISRLRVGSNTRPDRFATILSGLHPAVHALRGGR
ncbi:polysaccharide deacetylase family protein [Embleya sp. NBC_00896]|uniref:polysaccharide deacetylase family protein n=1 Tax=Embleya sp. NBC_00896 TaxID=2975961 RepID=UPI00386DD91F|nr:polysaccharide deacetylase family protein [Embleya sp. NBC_00896]